MNSTLEEVRNRRKTINLSAMTIEQLEALQEQISQRIASDFNELCDKTRKMLNLYGMDIKISYHIFEAGQDPMKSLKAPKAKKVAKQKK